MENIRKHPLYTVWKGMRARCFNPNHASWDRYGGRGIVPCLEWDDYSRFYEWSISNGYIYGKSLDRINNDEGYSPDNCRWTTYKEQGNNTFKNVFLKAWGEEKTISMWSEDIRCLVSLNTLYQRVELGWEPEDAILTPSQRRSTRRPLSFDSYQAIAETTAIYPGKGTCEGLQYAILGLCGEAGELANKIKKTLRDDESVLTENKRRELAEELSDVLWYCAAVASELGLSLEMIAQANLEKLADRAERNVIGGSGDNR